MTCGSTWTGSFSHARADALSSSDGADRSGRPLARSPGGRGSCPPCLRTAPPARSGTVGLGCTPTLRRQVEVVVAAAEQVPAHPGEPDRTEDQAQAGHGRVGHERVSRPGDDQRQREPDRHDPAAPQGDAQQRQADHHPAEQEQDDGEVGQRLLPHVGVQPLDGALVQPELDDGGGHGPVAREIGRRTRPRTRARSGHRRWWPAPERRAGRPRRRRCRPGPCRSGTAARSSCGGRSRPLAGLGVGDEAAKLPSSCSGASR